MSSVYLGCPSGRGCSHACARSGTGLLDTTIPSALYASRRVSLTPVTHDLIVNPQGLNCRTLRLPYLIQSYKSRPPFATVMELIKFWVVVLPISRSRIVSRTCLCLRWKESREYSWLSGEGRHVMDLVRVQRACASGDSGRIRPC